MANLNANTLLIFLICFGSEFQRRGALLKHIDADVAYRFLGRIRIRFLVGIDDDLFVKIKN